tara:strand:- start:483 stop:791 length:309 start_codon:yes stop_codon:yes gene_type:complete
MPNVSASLTDEAYAIWERKEGKKSPWVSELIVKGDSIMLESQAKSLRIAHLQGLLSRIVLDLDIARGGHTHYWTEDKKLLFNECLTQLEGTIHRFAQSDYKD